MRRFSIAVIATAAALFGFVIGCIVTIELLASAYTTAGSSTNDLFTTQSLERGWEILVGGTTGALISGWWAVILARRLASLT